MTTLNDHAQESESRFSCLSASDPEIIPDVRKEEIKYQYITKARKSNKPWLPEGRADDGALAPIRRPEGGRPRSVWVTEVTQNGVRTQPSGNGLT